MAERRKERKDGDKPQTPPELDAAVKRIFDYGPSRKRGKPPATNS